MRWSKLKQRVESRFAPSVRGRAELFQTRYRHAHDSLGEAWMTVDGDRILSLGELSFLQAERAAWAAELTSSAPTREEFLAANHAAHAALKSQGVTMLWQLNKTLLRSLSMSVDLMLKDPSPIVRGIGVVDGRLGKRRLRQLNMQAEHPFVQRMFEFRCEAEGIKPFGLSSPGQNRNEGG